VKLKRIHKVAVGLTAAATFGVGVMAVSHDSTASQAQPTTTTAVDAPAKEYTPTPAEVALFQSATNTPEKRAHLVAELQGAFAGVAEVHAGDVSPGLSATDASIQTVLSYGANWDHVWMTASYADMARGAIWGAVAYCKYRVPSLSWLCQRIGDTLSSWARGYPAISNHGVWGAVYWAPVKITGGRW
jgi:cytochrome bd-type quinol oxidase subunit 1